MSLGAHPTRMLNSDADDVFSVTRNAAAAVAAAANVEDVRPCARLQAGMLAETVKHPSRYCNWVELVFDASFTAPDLEKAFQRLARHHELLRTGFAQVEDLRGAFVQVVFKELEGHAVRIVERFDRSFVLDSPNRFLHPFRVQIISEKSCSALVHIHHALYDGWSWELLCHDLRLLLIGANPPKRPSFDRILRYDIQVSSRKIPEETVSFWKETASRHQNSQLPNLYGYAPSTAGLARSRRDLDLSLAKVENRARAIGVKPAALFEAVFGYLLTFYLDSKTVSFGTILAGRTIPVEGIEDIAGPCLQTLFNCVDIDHEDSISDASRRLHELQVSLQKHSDITLPEIRRIAGLTADAKLFDTLFVWQQTASLEYDDVLSKVDSGDELEFSLLLEIEFLDGQLHAKATYETALFPEEQIDVFLRQFSSLARLAVDTPPSVSLKALWDRVDEDILSIQPSRLETHEYPRLSSFVENAARNSPDKIALLYGHPTSGELDIQDMSYSALNSKANKVARFLRAQGVKSNDLVCIILEKSFDLYVSILAIIKLGAGYLPIMPDASAGRIDAILSQAQPKLGLVELDQSLPGDFKTVAFSEIDFSQLRGDDLDIEPALTDVAYTIFTSGTTGVPKGVAVTHGNLISNLVTLGELYPTRPDSKLLQFCPQAFDVSVFEIFFTWYRQMTLCFTTKAAALESFPSVINTLGVTHLSLTPTMAALIEPESVPNVCFLVTAGEAVTRKVFNSWAGKGLFQGYGPSETTNICTVKSRVSSRDSIDNIGPALANTSMLVLLQGDEFKIAPLGGVGELCFGGSQVFRGYLGLPEQSRQKLIEHPKHGRIYRSGDYGRLLSNGDILYVGRRDLQVKIRGHRIELEEISRTLLNLDTVENCSTIQTTHRGGPDQLVVFWIPRDQNPEDLHLLNDAPVVATTKDLFKHLKNALPSYMIPSFIIPISSIPQTAQDKIDNRRLQSLLDSTSDAELEHFTDHLESNRPILPSEDRIAQALADTVNMDHSKIHRDQPFISYGVDSLQAVRFVAKMKKLGLENASVGLVLEASSVSALAERLEEGTPLEKVKTSAGQGMEDPIFLEIAASCRREVTTAEDILPCTPLQEVMLSAATDDKTAYMNHFTFELFGYASRARSSWQLLARREPILRTAFFATNNHKYPFTQVVLSDFVPEIQVINESSESAIFEQKNHFRPRFDGQTPPYRLVLKGTTLLLSIHHSLYDGHSFAAILDLFEKIYKSDTLPQFVPFRSFLDFSSRCDLRAAQKYWTNIFTGFEPSRFPNLTASKEKANLAYATSQLRCSVSLKEITSRYQDLSVSLLAVVQSTWFRLLAAYTNENDLCFGHVANGRTALVEGIENIVGPCFNTVPVRANISQLVTNVDLMKYLINYNKQSSPHTFYPFRRLKMVGNASISLFDTIVILQSSPLRIDEKIWRLKDDIGEPLAAVTLEVTCDSENDTMEIKLYHRRDLIRPEDTSLLLACVEQTFVDCLKNPNGKLTDFGFLDSSSKAFVPERPDAVQTLDAHFIDEMFSATATVHEDDPAIEFWTSSGSETWTYAELEDNSNYIAQVLLSLDVDVEDAVVICMEKSPMFYACVLGALKSGAAFTPIEPSTPVERRNFMVKELRCKLLLYASTDVVIDGEICPLLDISSKTEILDSILKPDARPLKSLAYRMYTSGSTGTPKAVSIEHAAALAAISCARSEISVIPGEKFLQFASITFDMCYFDCLMAWSVGGCLCIARQDDLRDHLQQIVQDLNVTFLDLTPTVAAQVLPEKCPSVKTLYCIGEPLTKEIADRWGGRCINSYGPTEAAMLCTARMVQDNQSCKIAGRPFSSTSFDIVKAGTLDVQPVFAVGELCIGGRQLARDYYNKEDLTSERFVNLSNRRVFKTGDFARIYPDGSLEPLGRTDDQVKIRGMRVELGDISSVISKYIKHPVVTKLLKNAHGTVQLASFLAVGQDLYNRADSDPSYRIRLIESARQEASRVLPTHMIPSAILLVTKIPLSAAGKTDNKKLQSIMHDASAVEPDATEKCLQREWTEGELRILQTLSKVSKVSIESFTQDSTIYEIGLDSINAVAFSSALRKRGLALSTREILERPSLGQLIPFIEDKANAKRQKANPDRLKEFYQRHRGEVELTVSKHEKIQDILPPTNAQQGMLIQFIQSHGVSYLNHITFELEKNIDIEKLYTAWHDSQSQLEILRCGFVELEQGFASVVWNSNVIDFPWIVDSNIEDSISAVEYWLPQIRQSILEQLCQPPWRLVLLSKVGKLMLFAHHALFDARTLELMLQVVRDNYYRRSQTINGCISGALAAILQESQDRLAESEHYWKALGSQDSRSEFPNLAVSRVDSVETNVVEWDCEVADFRERCREKGVSIQAVLRAGLARLLGAYMNDMMVTFGLVLTGQTTVDELENTVFPCISTLPTTYDLQKSNIELVRAIMEGDSALFSSQLSPPSKIRKWMGSPEGDPFDVILSYQKILSEQQDLWHVESEAAYAEYKVSVEIEERQKLPLRIRITHRVDILPPEQARLFAKQLEAFVTETLSAPDQAASQYEFSDDLLSVLPAQESPIPCQAKLLHEFVDLAVRNHPGKAALEFWRGVHSEDPQCERYSYAQLNNEGEKIASALLHRGVRPKSLVATCFDKCPEASFAFLGILKAGCAFVPIDPGAPLERKRFILADSKAHCILTTDSLASSLDDVGNLPIIRLDDPENVYSNSMTTDRIKHEVLEDDLCYCLYTSGTSGKPKGCEITHKNAVQAMCAFQRMYGGRTSSESRFLQFASFHFDVSVMEQFWSWSVGIAVVSCSRDEMLEDIANTIVKLNITHVDLTPSLAQLVKPEDMPHLAQGVFIIGGEAMRQNILDAWAATGAVYNAYGPTEVTIGCTMYPNVQRLAKPSNIGRQFDNVGTFVLFSDGDRPVIRGGIGELCVSGPLVGRGYLNRPDLNSTKFTYLGRYGERIYRTGDLVRLLHDGAFEFLGRQDDQVKLRGQRLELGEIESVIRNSQASIKDCKTLVLKHLKQGKDQLVSFVVFQDGDSSKERIDRISQCCRQSLQPYMIPTYFIPLEKIPLSANNKADINALRERFTTTNIEHLADANEDDSWNNIEVKIRSAVSKTADLDLDDIQKHQNFFHLGLDSISMLRLARNIKKEGVGSVAVSTILQHLSIARLAEALASSAETKTTKRSLERYERQLSAFVQKHMFSVCQELGIEDSAIECMAPCTPLQEAFVSYAFREDNSHYFTRVCLKLADGMDLEQLRRAWESAADEIEILRTCFRPTSDGYAQVVLRKGLSSFKILDITADEVEHKRPRDHIQWWKRAKSLEEPPWEVRIYKCKTSIKMDLSIFHGIYDGYSLPLLLSEVEKRYEHVRTTHQRYQYVLPFGPLADHELSKAFWEEHFQGFKFTPFPPLSQYPTGEDILVRLQIDQSKGLKLLQRNIEASFQAIFLACWLAVLRKYAGDEFTTGIVLSGRGNLPEEMQDAIGPVFNTIPYRNQTKTVNTLRDLILLVQEYLSRTSLFQHTPLRKISKWTNQSKLVDNFFVFEQQDDLHRVKSRAHWTFEDAAAPADGVLAIEVSYLSTGRIDLTLVSDGSIVDRDGLVNLLAEYKELFAALICNSDTELPGKILGSSRNETLNGLFKQNELSPSVEFEWNEHSETLREEIAALGQLESARVGPQTSILELGLDSIDAVKLSSRLRKRGITIGTSKIMATLTIERMVEQLEVSADCPTNDFTLDFDAKCQRLQDIIGLSGRGLETVMPATPMQEAMLAETLASDFARYVNHDLLRLRSGIDIDKLRSALVSVVAKSPILRTTFHEVDDPEVDSVFAQAVHQDHPLRWDEISLPITPEDWTTLFGQEKRSISFDEPLYHFLLVKSDNERYLALTIHHALYDGWSLNLLHRDILDTYYGHSATRPDNKLFIRGAVRTLKESEQFWRNNLRGLDATLVSNSFELDLKSKTYRSVKSSVSLATLENFSRKHRITFRTIGEACWAITLAQLLHGREVTFGTVLSGREDSDSEQVLFPLMNTSLTRVVIHGTYVELLSYVQALSSASAAHQNVSLRNIKRVWGGNKKIFDTLFLYQPTQKTESNPVPIFESVSSDADDEYTVAVEMAIADKLTWTVRCSHIKDSEHLAEKIVQNIDETLNKIINYPQDEPVAAASERTKLHEANGDVDSKEITNLEKWSSVELPVVKVLASVSKTPVEKISRSNTIYHLGLDSISCIKVASMLNKKSLHVKVRDLVAAENINELVQKAISKRDSLSSTTTNDHITEEVNGEGEWRAAANAALQKYSIDPDEIEAIAPASAGQIYTICRWQATRGQEFYAAFPFILPVALKKAQMQGAWSGLVSSSTILRTSLLAVEDKILFSQLVWRRPPCRVVWLNSITDYQSAVEALDVDALHPPVQLYATEDNEGTLVVLRIHHALYDAVTLPRLQHQLLRSVNGEHLDDAIKLHAPSTISINSLKEQKGFWTRYLHGLSISEPRKWENTFNDPSVEILLKRRFSNHSSIAKRAKLSGLSVNALFFASLSKVISPRLSSRDLVLGIYLANRSTDDENIDRFFPTANVVPLRIRDSQTRGLIEIARHVQRDLQVISQAPHVWTNLLQIQEWTGIVLDHVVNVLNVPDDPVNSSMQKKIREFHGTIPGALLSKAESRNNRFYCPPSLRYKDSGSIFPPALNIEIKRMVDSFDVGMFCPSSMYSDRDVQDIVIEMEKLLSNE